MKMVSMTFQMLPLFMKKLKNSFIVHVLIAILGYYLINVLLINKVLYNKGIYIERESYTAQSYAIVLIGVLLGSFLNYRKLNITLSTVIFFLASISSFAYIVLSGYKDYTWSNNDFVDEGIFLAISILSPVLVSKILPRQIKK